MRKIINYVPDIIIYFILILTVITEFSIKKYDSYYFFICLFIFSFFAMQFAKNFVAKYIDNTYIGIYLLCFLGLLIFLGSFSSNFYLHYKICAYIFTGIFFYFSLANYFNKHNYRIIFNSFICLALTLLLFSSYDLINKLFISSSHNEIILYNPNIIAHLIIILSPFLLISATFSFKKNKLQSLTLFFISFLLFICLLFTLSRSALITYFLIIIILFFLHLYKLSKLKKLFFIILAVLFLTIVFIPKNFFNRFVKEQTIKSKRIEQYITYYKISKDNLLTGVGLGNSILYLNNYSKKYNKFSYTNISSFLIILAETGVFGTLFFIFIIISIYKAIFNIYNNSNINEDSKIMLLGSAAAISGHFIHSLFGCFYHIPIISIIIISFLAIISSLNSQLRIQSYYSNLLIAIISVSLFLFIFIDYISINLIKKENIKYKDIKRAQNLIYFNPDLYISEFNYLLKNEKINCNPLLTSLKYNNKNSKIYYYISLCSKIKNNNNNALKYIKKARNLNKFNANYELVYGLLENNIILCERAFCLKPELIDILKNNLRNNILNNAIKQSNSKEEISALNFLKHKKYSNALKIYKDLDLKHKNNWYIKKIIEYLKIKNLNKKFDIFNKYEKKLFYLSFPKLLKEE